MYDSNKNNSSNESLENKNIQVYSKSYQKTYEELILKEHQNNNNNKIFGETLSVPSFLLDDQSDLLIVWDLRMFETCKYEIQNDPWVIQPTGNFYYQFNGFIFLLLLYLMFYIPLSLSENGINDMFFTIQIAQQKINVFFQYHFNNFITGVFTLDILISFNSAQLDDQGNMIEDKGLIVQNQLETWFLFDLVSTFPVDLVLTLFQVESNNLGNLAKVLRLIKYWRLIKILRMNKVFNNITKSEQQKQLNDSYGDTFKYVLKIIKSIFVITSVTHTLVCILVKFAKDAVEPEPENNYYHLNPRWWATANPNWYRYWCEYKIMIFNDQVSCDTYSDIYLVAVQQIIQTLTTVGYGDVNPATPSERLFIMLTMVVGVIVFGDFMGNLAEMNQTPSSDVDKRKLINDIRRMQIDYNLHGRSMLNLEQLMFKVGDKQIRQDFKLISKLPNNKQLEVFGNIKTNLEKYISFQSHIPIEAFVKIMEVLKMQQQGEGDTIVEEGPDRQGVLIVDKGVVGMCDRMLHKYRLTNHGLQDFLNLGETFGFAEFLWHDSTICLLTCFEHCEILQINADRLFEVMIEFDLTPQFENWAASEVELIQTTKYAVLIILNLLKENLIHVEVTDLFNLVNQLGDIKYKKNITPTNTLKSTFNQFTKLHHKNHHNIFFKERWWHNIIGQQQDSQIINQVKEKTVNLHALWIKKLNLMKSMLDKDMQSMQQVGKFFQMRREIETSEDESHNNDIDTDNGLIDYASSQQFQAEEENFRNLQRQRQKSMKNSLIKVDWRNLNYYINDNIIDKFDDDDLEMEEDEKDNVKKFISSRSFTNKWYKKKISLRRKSMSYKKTSQNIMDTK